jgi:hypothetical protein
MMPSKNGTKDAMISDEDILAFEDPKIALKTSTPHTSAPVRRPRLGPMEVYSSQNVANEYLTLKGIELRTGIKREELFTAIAGEMIDNSVDDMENHGVDNPQVQVTVRVLPLPSPPASPALSDYHILKILIRNSHSTKRASIFKAAARVSLYLRFPLWKQEILQNKQGSIGRCIKADTWSALCVGR